MFPYIWCRTEEENQAAGMLANMSQSTAALAAAGGQDPLNNALVVAGAEVKPANGQVRLPAVLASGNSRDACMSLTTGV